MYLKNTSTTVSVIVNTTRGKVGIKPQGVADIKYKILPPVSRSLVQLTEDEYLLFLEGTKGTTEAIIEAKGEDAEQPVIIPDEDKLEELERSDDEVVEIQDNSIMGFVNSLLEPKQVETAENDALVVTETDSSDEIARLEQQIADLKESWASTKTPRKKERIQKEIKELQKQLKKISK